MYRFSLMLLVLSMGLTLWIAREVGLFSYTKVDAAEPVTQAQSTQAQPPSAETANLLAAREEAIRKKEQELNEREALLNEQVKRYDRLLNERAAQSAQRERTIASENSKNEVSMVYEKMDPKKAAKILENLDVSYTSQILKSMKQDRAADILSRISAGKAKLITERLFAMKSNSAVQKVNPEVQ